MSQEETLQMVFDGTATSRRVFLEHIRVAVMDFTGERMRLDVLINEIAKNIFDHANKIGSLSIVRKGNSFEFSMRDGGQNYYDFDECLNHSTSAMNGINFGVGLKTIRDFAEFLGIDLHIDTSKGFSYSGIYRK